MTVMFFSLCGTKHELIPCTDIMIRSHKRDDVSIEAQVYIYLGAAAKSVFDGELGISM